MSPITTHILDVSKGRPAAGVAVQLEQQTPGGWKPLARAATDDDGRVRDLLPDDAKLDVAVYRLVFDTGGYFERDGLSTFYLSVIIEFSITAPAEHHHVPLLLSPFGYTTYRGS